MGVPMILNDLGVGACGFYADTADNNPTLAILRFDEYLSMTLPQLRESLTAPVDGVGSYTAADFPEGGAEAFALSLPDGGQCTSVWIYAVDGKSTSVSSQGDDTECTYAKSVAAVIALR